MNHFSEVMYSGIIIQSLVGIHKVLSVLVMGGSLLKSVLFSVLGMGEDLLKIDVTCIAVFLPTSGISILLSVAITVMGEMGLHIIE